MHSTTKYTYRDLPTLPDDNRRHELFEGELVMTPSPNTAHQNAVANLFRIFALHVEIRSAGKLFPAPLDVYFDEETILQPDILFVSASRLHIIDEQKVNGAPDLIVEVLSPGTEQRDRGFKFYSYAKAGVKEYWLVDPVQQTVEIFYLRSGSFNLSGRFGRNDTITSSILHELVFPANDIWM